MQYLPKIIIAWGEAISGNRKIRDWLIKNGFPELGLFVYALHHKKDARDWMIANGHPQLMALVHASEGNKEALAWLRKQKLDILEHMALGADNDDSAIDWLVSKGFPDLAVVAHKIRIVKNEIEADHNDVHKFSAD